MQSKRSGNIPPPLAHEPRIQQQTTNATLLAILKRKHAKVTPVDETSVNVHLPVVEAEQKVLSPAEKELIRLSNRRTARLVLQEEGYKEHKLTIEKGITALISAVAYNVENQAAVVMAKANAEKVATALINLHNDNVTITNTTRLNLVAAQAQASQVAEAAKAAEVAKQEAIKKFDNRKRPAAATIDATSTVEANNRRARTL